MESIVENKIWPDGFGFILVRREGGKYDVMLYIKPALWKLLIAVCFEAVYSNGDSTLCWLLHKQNSY